MLTQKKERKTILIVDNNSELELMVREPLTKHLESSSVSAVLVRAKDGAEAARKSENQKFDIVLIDTEVPRLMDGGFVYGIRKYKNTCEADVMVVSQREANDLPEQLQGPHFFKKPFSPDSLINAMVSALNSQPGQTQASKKETMTSPSASRFAVDVRVINAIIKATTNVLGQYGVTSVEMGKAAQKSPHEEMLGEVSSIIDIKSKSFQGMMTISFDKGSYLEVVSSMLMEEQTEINSENQDAVGEINNIIFGNAKAEITTYGVELTVPKVVLGANQCAQCPDGSAGMMIPFTTGKGKFYLTVVALPLANIKAA